MLSIMEKFLNIIIFCCTFSTNVLGVCYFPVEYQGIFSTQASLTSSSTHKYSTITILPDAVPVWGVCHTMEGSNAILYDGTGGQECFRCFQITLHSPNIIQVYTEGLDKCYTHEGAARASCPSTSDIKNRIAREIMLYKSRSFTRDGSIDRVFCPFSGKYHFTYDVNDGFESEVECPESKSVLSNCPRGSHLELKFIQCKFRDSTMGLRCLGDWIGVDGYRYFALWDTRVASETQPQYRCGMYHRDDETGRIFISFSIDATCTNRLQSPWDGYETMILTPSKMPPPPAPVHSHSCTFPLWTHGKWKDIQIESRDLKWNDEKRDKVYQTLCLSQHEPNRERFSLYSLNQCEDQEFTCIWIRKRDANVMEFKIATVQHNYFNSSIICDDEVFIGQTWQTQGRLTDSEETNCPVLGEYTGVIPDDPDLCARIASDCEHPQLMRYSVYACSNSSQAFEERVTNIRGKRNAIYRITNPRELIQLRHQNKNGNRWRALQLPVVAVAEEQPIPSQYFAPLQFSENYSRRSPDSHSGTGTINSRTHDRDSKSLYKRPGSHSYDRRTVSRQRIRSDPNQISFGNKYSERDTHSTTTISIFEGRATLERRRHHRLIKIKGSDPTYVFPGPTNSELNDTPASTTNRRPYPDEKPFYYIVDQYGREVHDVPQPITLVAGQRIE